MSIVDSCNAELGMLLVRKKRTPKARESLPTKLKFSRLPSSGERKGSSSAKRVLSKTWDVGMTG